jgi:hypothetical protein
MQQHIAPSIPKYSGFADAKVLALIIGEMSFESILSALSPRFRVA